MQIPLDRLKVQSLKSSEAVLPIFYEDMKSVLNHSDGDHNLDSVLQIKHKEIQEEKVKGVVLYDQGQPKAFAWFEVLGAYYGSVLAHSLESGYERALMSALVKTGLLDIYLFEMMTFVPSDMYGDTLLSLGMQATHRSRMGLWLQDWRGAYFEDPDITFEPLTEERIKLSTKISIAAHKVSKDQLLSRDLSIPKNRINLERKVVTSQFGKTVQEATLLMSFMGKHVGFITMVEINCWGKTNVPWIFDISILPEYHGKV